MLTALLLPLALAAEPDDRSRIGDLVDDTVAMAPEDRTVYLQALVNGGRESGIVTAGLVEAIRATAGGQDYEATLARALAVAPARGGDAPVALPALTDLDARLVKDYRRRYYSVRTEIRSTGGGTQMWSSPPYAWGGPVMVSDTPVTVTRSWGVYQGNQRLDVPRFLELSGRVEERHDLVTRVALKRWLGRTYYGAAVGGVGAVLFSAVAINATGDPSRKDLYESIGATGLAVAVVGLIGGSVPTANAARLETDYALSEVDIGTAEEAVATWNAALREEVGLTEGQALAIEAETPASVVARPR